MVNSRTGVPLSGAQVVVEGTGIGTVTDTRGRFVLLDVPSGTRTITAQLLGHAGESAEDTPSSRNGRDQ